MEVNNVLFFYPPAPFECWFIYLQAFDGGLYSMDQFSNIQFHCQSGYFFHLPLEKLFVQIQGNLFRVVFPVFLHNYCCDFPAVEDEVHQVTI
mmetsp:Transcript_20368/g.28093  ORF Transcript_20368/g.28093 Transcript_20368/m.28093 type:complete len:92 (-) Transcript_20368:62-337(-)